MLSGEVSIEDLLSGKVRLEFGNAGQLCAIKHYEMKTERELTQCATCEGEGTIVCGICNGTGEKK